MPVTGAAKREKEARRRDKRRRELNDIGEIPPIENPERRTTAEKNTALWLQTYLPEHFFKPFSDSQLDFIRRADAAIERRGYQNVNAYRSFGKTTILSGIMVKSHCTGHTRYAIYISSVDAMSDDASAFFEDALFEPLTETDPDNENDNGWNPEKPLCQDYPEICYPIARRDQVAQKPLLYHGRKTNIDIKTGRIVFPLIPGSKTNHSLLIFTSIHSNAIRGRRHIIPGEGTYRPDIVMIDDVQSDGTAKSDEEVKNILGIISNSVEGLAGYDKKTGHKKPLIILSALTQNQPNDVAVKMKDRAEYNTKVYQFLKTVPDDFSSWRAYRSYREEIMRRHQDKGKVQPLLKRYYTKHREEIESGITVDNPTIYEEGQVGAIHFALEIWCKSEKAFWCELQNDAARASQEVAGGLSPIVVLRKKRPSMDNDEQSKPLGRLQIPKNTEVLTAFIDCGEHYHNWQVTAFGHGFEFAHVVDFGVWPEQNYPTTKKSSFRRDLQDVYRTGDKFERVGDAVIECLIKIFTQQYFDYRGKPIDIHGEVEFRQHATQRPFRFLTICGVDCSDGEMEIALWRAIDRFHRKNDGEFFGRAIPCYGDAAASRLMRYYDLSGKEWRRGKKETGNCDWIENPRRSDGIRRQFANIPASLLYDANTAKTRRNKAWMTDLSHPGSESLFEWPEPDYLEMFARHQCAEEFLEDWKSNLRYLRWRMKKPRFEDNEFLDTDAGCWAMANYVGIEFAGFQVGRRIQRVQIVRQEKENDPTGTEQEQPSRPIESERRRRSVGIIGRNNDNISFGR